MRELTDHILEQSGPREGETTLWEMEIILDRHSKAYSHAHDVTVRVF